MTGNTELKRVLKSDVAHEIFKCVKQNQDNGVTWKDIKKWEKLHKLHDNTVARALNDLFNADIIAKSEDKKVYSVKNTLNTTELMNYLQMHAPDTKPMCLFSYEREGKHLPGADMAAMVTTSDIPGLEEGLRGALKKQPEINEVLFAAYQELHHAYLKVYCDWYKETYGINDIEKELTFEQKKAFFDIFYNLGFSVTLFNDGVYSMKFTKNEYDRLLNDAQKRD
jgi:hypothetical protein